MGVLLQTGFERDHARTARTTEMPNYFDFDTEPLSRTDTRPLSSRWHHDISTADLAGAGCGKPETAPY
jgi:hypothetical protein